MPQGFGTYHAVNCKPKMAGENEKKIERPWNKRLNPINRVSRPIASQASSYEGFVTVVDLVWLFVFVLPYILVMYTCFGWLNSMIFAFYGFLEFTESSSKVKLDEEAEFPPDFKYSSSKSVLNDQTITEITKKHSISVKARY